MIARAAPHQPIAAFRAPDLPPLIDVPLSPPEARDVATITPREVIGAARLADGRLVLILDPRRLLEVCEVPPILLDHLQRRGASVP